METLIQDVRYALVTMRRNQTFTAAALITLGLGIGATTAVFSVVYGVLLRPLPYPTADRLVRLSEEHPGAVSVRPVPMLSNLTYYAWSQSPRTIDAIAASDGRQYTVTLPEGAARLDGAAVTPSLFPLLGATPALGRFFRPDESAHGANGVLVLSDRGWRERFHADPSVVGRGVVVDDQPCTIVGVAPPGFSFPDRSTLLWMPLEVLRPLPDAVAGGRGNFGVVTALGRLTTGVTPVQAETEGTARARSTVRPMAANMLLGVGGPVVVHVRGVVDEMTARVRPALLVLAAAAVFVLLIACANVANLFLSRGVARQRELTLRAAIGASRGRLARQLFTESAVLSALGGAIGISIAWTLVRLTPLLASRNFPRMDDVQVDARMLAFAAVASVFTTVAAGLTPAIRGARFDLAESLHGGDGASAGGFRGARARRLRDVLLVAESAFAVVLLVGALLLARSFVRLTHVDGGYTPDHVLTAEVVVPIHSAGKAMPLNSLMASVRERTTGLPDVVAAGVGNMIPLDNSSYLAGFPSPWTAPGTAARPARALQYLVTPGYPEALGLRLRGGRLFTRADVSSGVRPWIVNEEFARLYLPPHPVGFRFEQRPDSGPITIEIIGVVANVLKNGNDAKPQPEYYRLLRNDTRLYGQFEILVRTAGNPAALARPVRELVRQLAPTAAVETVPLSKRVAASVDEPRFAMTVLMTFALVALALASVGLYGVLSYAVSQRRRELGVRAALGAARGDLIGLVLREGLRLLAIGVALGLAGATALTRLMEGALFGVTPLDTVSFAAAPLVLIPVAAVACLLPAYRAASVDPSEALRCE